jgi:hypothetical protein
MAKKKATKASKEGNSLGPKPKGLFDHLNHIREKQDPKYFENLSDADKKSWSNYMIAKFLSMQPDIIESVNEIQKYWELEPKYFYQCCIAVTPLGRAFFPYIKGKKEDKYSKELIILLKNHFSESKKNVVTYLSLLNEKEIKSIVMQYGHTEDEADDIISS